MMVTLLGWGWWGEEQEQESVVVGGAGWRWRALGWGWWGEELEYVGVSSSVVCSYWSRVGAQVGIACKLSVALSDQRFGGDI